MANVDSAGSASGLGDASGVGASFADATGIAAGVGDVTAAVYNVYLFGGAVAGAPVGSVALGASILQPTTATIDAVGSADGTGDATAFGTPSVVDAIGSADGNGDATAVSAPFSLVDASGSADGTGDATGVGGPLVDASGSADGSGDLTALDDFVLPQPVTVPGSTMSPGMGGAPSPPAEYFRKKKRRKPRVINRKPDQISTGLDEPSVARAKKEEPRLVDINRVIASLADEHVDDEDEAFSLILALAA